MREFWLIGSGRKQARQQSVRQWGALVQLRYTKAISKFYEAATNIDIWPEALQAIAEATGSRGALLTTPVFIPGGLSHSSDLKEAVHQFFDEAWYTRDERTAAVKNHHFRAGFFTDLTLFSERHLAKSEYYEKFARRANVPWFAAGRLKGELNDDAVALSLQRSAAQGHYTNEDVASLNTLLPHLEQSMKLASRLAGIEGKALMDGLQLAKQPALLLKPSGSVAFVNEAAEKILGSRLFIRQQRLFCSAIRQNQLLQTLISETCEAARTFVAYTAPSDPVILPPSEIENRLVITAAPIRRTGTDVLCFSGVIVMVTDMAFGVNLSPVVLQSVFDLTMREATVMSCIGQGKSLKEAAAKLGLAHETVRHHVKSIFGKTGVRQQSELIALCAKLFPTLGQSSLSGVLYTQ